MTVVIPSTAKNSRKLAGTTPTAAGLALLDDVNAAAQCTTLGLGTSNTPAFTGLTLSSGTLVADAPALSITQTWNNAAVSFTGLKLNVTNTNSAAGSLLVDIQQNSATRFFIANKSSAGAYGTTPSFGCPTNNTNGVIINASYLCLGANSSIAWFSAGINSASWAGNQDLSLVRDAANTLALRNGTNAQAFNIYNTYTDATTYERLSVAWATNICTLHTNKGSVGGTARQFDIGTSGSANLNFFTNSVYRWQMNTNGHLLSYSDNTFDIGASANYRPRNIYAGSSIQAGGAIVSLASYLSVYGEIRLGNLNAYLYGDAANTLALRNGTNAQAFKLYNTYTSGTNYERLGINWSGNLCTIATEAQTGTQRNLKISAPTITINGAVIMDALPTSDPLVNGKLWNSAGTLKISSGA